MANPLRDRLKQAYDRGAEERDHRVLPQWKIDERSRFLKHLQKDRLVRLLEVGAGVGRDGRFFADRGYEVVCIDLSPEMVRRCWEKGLDAAVMDVAQLALEDASFDAVYAFNSLLHLHKTELPAVLLEIRRVLRPGGLFYFGTYGGFDHEGIFEEDDHSPLRFFSFYEEGHLKRVVGEVFDILEFRSLVTPGDTSQIRFQSMLLQRPVVA